MAMGAIIRVYEDGSIEIVSEPRVLYCRYMHRVYGVERGCREAIERVTKFKMEVYGLFTSRRKLDFRPAVLFGSSEIISWAMEKELFDCAVVVCDGAGTVIAKNSSLVQGIGAVMNGLLKTYPVPGVINEIKKRGGVVLDEEGAAIDQVAGVLKAIELGCRSIAVTVIGPKCWEISEIKRVEGERHANIAVFSTCNTLASKDCLEHVVKADYVCTSANTELRRVLAGKALLQLGVTIPVYVLTERMRDIVLEYLKSVNQQLVIRKATLPYEEPYTTQCTFCEQP
jgi:putative methanogenesis marker protein 8